MSEHKFIVPEEFNLKRLDQAVAAQFKKISRTKISKIIKSSLLKVNDKVVTDQSVKIKKDDVITFTEIKDQEINLTPKKMNLNIIHEDEDIIIIDKPVDMVVHPGAGNYEDTMVN